MQNKTDRWIQHFPYKKPREQQVEAINSIIDSFESGKSHYILEAGTGVGKSAIAATVAQYFINNGKVDKELYKKGTLFVTTQKLLQAQYEKDFAAAGMRSIKSSSNYQCKFKKNNSCADSQTELRAEGKGSAFWNACSFSCKYKKEKEAFLESNLSVTNFPYLLTESNYSGKITSRQILVIDEAHNAETELSKFIEVSVSEHFAKHVLKLMMPRIVTQLQAFNWIKDTYFPKLNSHAKHVKGMLEKYSGLKTKLEKFVSLSRQLQMMESHHKKIEYFLEVHSSDNWVFEIQKSTDRGSKKFSFKPIDVSQFAEQYLFRLGHKILFMSATIIDTAKFSELLGLTKEKTDSLCLPSPFPIDNRPILFVPIGKMVAREIDSTLPKLAEAVRRILEEHKGDKGVIHAHSYKIANYIKYNVKSSRLLVPNSENRGEVLQEHLNSKKPTVLVSPSMTEGINLEGDASRFQILCKVPYPYLGDQLVKKRMNKWSWWYSFKTVKTIIQSVGRSVRSKDDTAVTYILDADWDRFFDRNSSLFPKDFRDCLK